MPKLNIDGITPSSFQIGKDGGKLKYFNNEFFFRNSNDTFYLKVHGGDPTENSHFATKAYVDGQVVAPSTKFYGISVSETDGSPSYSGLNKLNFDNTYFYISQNSPNIDEVVVSFRGLDKYRHTIIGGVADVGKNTTKAASYGNNSATADPVMAYPGSVVALSISLSSARTQGSITLQVKKNGIAQTGASQVAVIDTNGSTKYAILAPAITYVPGDTIGLQTVTAGTFSDDKADATLLAYCEETI